MATIRHNDERNEIELWLDGKFQASWDDIELPEESRRIIEAMIDYGVEHGKYLNAAEVRAVIGAKRY
jgi:hypothetical protein